LLAIENVRFRVFELNIQLAAVVVAVGKWESRAFAGFPSLVGKYVLWTFPPDVFPTAADVATI
jgi:hypothetical protein